MFFCFKYLNFSLFSLRTAAYYNAIECVKKSLYNNGANKPIIISVVVAITIPLNSITIYSITLSNTNSIGKSHVTQNSIYELDNNKRERKKKHTIHR